MTLGRNGENGGVGSQRLPFTIREVVYLLTLAISLVSGAVLLRERVTAIQSTLDLLVRKFDELGTTVAVMHTAQEVTASEQRMLSERVRRLENHGSEDRKR